MSERTKLTIGADGLVRDANGIHFTTFVDSFLTAELFAPNISVICLRLYESTEQRHGRKAGAGGSIDPSSAHQFRMSSRTARALAEQLLDLADHLEGTDADTQ